MAEHRYNVQCRYIEEKCIGSDELYYKQGSFLEKIVDKAFCCKKDLWKEVKKINASPDQYKNEEKRMAEELFNESYSVRLSESLVFKISCEIMRFEQTYSTSLKCYDAGIISFTLTDRSDAKEIKYSFLMKDSEWGWFYVRPKYVRSPCTASNNRKKFNQKIHSLLIKARNYFWEDRIKHAREKFEASCLKQKEIRDLKNAEEKRSIDELKRKLNQEFDQ